MRLTSRTSFIGQIDLNNVSNVENNLSDENYFIMHMKVKLKIIMKQPKILIRSSVAINFLIILIMLMI